MKNFYTLFFIFTLVMVKAQDFNCGIINPFDTTDVQNLPWYGYNEYLDSLADIWGYNDPIPQYSVGQSNVEGGFDGLAEVWIPVKAWVYRNNNGSGGITEAEVEESIRELNNRFNGTFDYQGQAPPPSFFQICIFKGFLV